jgi:hypothetical protein
MKSLYNEEGRYTEEANELSKELGGLLKPIMKRMMDKGYCTREIAYAMIDAAQMTEITVRVMERMKKEELTD